MLRLILFFERFQILWALKGLIWSKKNQDFIPLSSFSLLNEDNLKYESNITIFNLQKLVVKMVHFQETNFLIFSHNDTKVSGVAGEVWTMLSEFLNFTLIPIKLDKAGYGRKLDNGSYDGSLGYIERNEAVVIPRLGIFVKALPFVEYTIPLWKTHFNLFIKPEWKYDEVWMFRLFSPRVWYCFIFVLLFLILTGYACQRYSIAPHARKLYYSLNDRVIYTIAMAGTQGFVPDEFHQRSRIVYFCTSMFTYVIAAAFSSYTIILMMNKSVALPFNDLKSLIQGSTYRVIAFNGSLTNKFFRETVASYFRNTKDVQRVSYLGSGDEVFKRVCNSSLKRIAAFEAQDRFNVMRKNLCKLVATPTSYFGTWIASAVRREFPYKRSFDIGIIKIIESGLLECLKDRWLEWHSREKQEIPFESIHMSQVYLIFCLLSLGFMLSVLILLMENCVYYRNQNRRSEYEDIERTNRGRFFSR